MAEQTKKRAMNTDDETSKTSANPKKKKQFQRSDEGKLSKKQSDRQRGKTRVTIGVALPRWRALKEEKGLRGDTDVAIFLLDCYECYARGPPVSPPDSHGDQRDPAPSISSIGVESERDDALSDIGFVEDNKEVDVLQERFHWNNWGENEPHQTQTAKRSGCDVEKKPDCKMESVDSAELVQVHNYDVRPPLGAHDEALEKIQELEELVSTLSRPLLDRWCVSDEDFSYFTRFSSKHTFCVFWRSVEPSASRGVYWSIARRIGIAAVEKEVISPSPTYELRPIDEFFMFCLRVAAGLRERVLAEIFGVSTSTVSCILITWSNYLYFVLGSVQMWMTRAQVRRTMPVKFQQYSPNLRVIVDCMEFRCESPEAISPHSEAFSTYKSYTTFKALIGVAPCGAITFASKLFTGSISDKELTRQSGILELLEPGDEIMANNGFLIEKLLEDVGAKLIVPPSMHQSESSREEAERTQAIARLRILVERAIRRIKDYHIWDSPVPLTLAGSVDQIWSCCCMMANYQGPLDVEGEVKYWVE